MYDNGRVEIAEILNAFQSRSGRFEHAAVAAAVEHRQEITDGLLHILEDTLERAEELAPESDYMAHLYAMYLLAQFRETRAYPLVVRLASLPGELADSIAGEFFTEGLGKVLASVCGGELAGIHSLIENEHLDEWARWGALEGLVTLVAAGQKSREEILNYFATLFRGKLAREWSSVWDGLVGCTCDLYPAELMEDIKRAFEEDLVDINHINMDDVQGILAEGQHTVIAELSGNSHHALVDDIVKEMAWWHCFAADPIHDEAASPPAANFRFNQQLKQAVAQRTPVTQIKRAAPKVGRNEPCPCGSGKKYKKCCGA